jgi:hypothetical protein
MTAAFTTASSAIGYRGCQMIKGDQRSPSGPLGGDTTTEERDMQTAIQFVTEDAFSRNAEPRADDDFVLPVDETGAALQLVTIRLAHPVSLDAANDS